MHLLNCCMSFCRSLLKNTATKLYSQKLIHWWDPYCFKMLVASRSFISATQCNPCLDFIQWMTINMINASPIVNSHQSSSLLSMWSWPYATLRPVMVGFWQRSGLPHQWAGTLSYLLIQWRLFVMITVHTRLFSGQTASPVHFHQLRVSSSDAV